MTQETDETKLEACDALTVLGEMRSQAANERNIDDVVLLTEAIEAIKALPRSPAFGKVLKTIEWQCLRWGAGSPELAAANVILSALRLRYGDAAPASKGDG